MLKICNKLEIEMLFRNVQTQYLYLNPLKHQQHEEHIYEYSFIKTDNIYLKLLLLERDSLSFKNYTYIIY